MDTVFLKQFDRMRLRKFGALALKEYFHKN